MLLLFGDAQVLSNLSGREDAKKLREMMVRINDEVAKRAASVGIKTRSTPTSDTHKAAVNAFMRPSRRASSGRSLTKSPKRRPDLL